MLFGGMMMVPQNNGTMVPMVGFGVSMIRLISLILGFTRVLGPKNS